MTRAWLIVPAVAAIAALAVFAPPVSASSSLPCSATMSNTRPADYTTTDVRIRTSAQAEVFTVAFYKTTDRAYYKVASDAGNAAVAYYISGATPGYKVKVQVTVVSGDRVAECSTAFTPQR